jgi:hypothetical protein
MSGDGACEMHASAQKTFIHTDDDPGVGAAFSTAGVAWPWVSSHSVGKMASPGFIYLLVVS